MLGLIQSGDITWSGHGKQTEGKHSLCVFKFSAHTDYQTKTKHVSDLPINNILLSDQKHWHHGKQYHKI